METLQPKLRFPEFKDNWNKNKLDNFTKSISSGKSKTRESEGEYFLYGSTGIIGYTDANDYEGKCILVARVGANAGNLYKVDGNYSVTDNTLMLYINEDNFFDFTYYLLINAGLNKLVFGSGQPLITGGQLKNLDLFVPKINEQTKIANFLSSVDEKLNLLKEKKTLLEDYKKGIMQKIFNQEIRFKDDNGDDFEDWIETNLGGICEFENGKAHENEIDENGDFVVVNSKFVSTNGRVRKYTNKIISRLDKNDIVMVMSDVPNGKAIAKCYYIEEDNKYSLNQRICKIRIVNNDSKYIYYLINRNPYYLAFDSGVGQTNLRKDEVLDCPLYIPKDINEQTKIANFLSAIDEKIELVSNQIQDTQEYKKGLLQQMFV